MSIAALTKVALVFPQHNTDDVFNQLQSWGKLHIIAPEKSHQEIDRKITAEQTQAELSRCEQALLHLKQSQTQRKQVRHLEFDVQKLIDTVLINKEKHQACIQEQLKLQKKIETLKPWGYFNWPTQSDLGGQRLWFYCIPAQQKHKIAHHLNYKIVHEDARHCWCLIVAKDEPEKQYMPFTRTHIGKKTLADLEVDAENLGIELEDLEVERAALTRWSTHLRNHANSLSDKVSLMQAKKSLQNQGSVNSIEGWCETQKLPELQALITPQNALIISQKAQSEDEPPTLLKNPKALQAAQKLVSFFQYPGYQDWDPTPILHVSFILFYAMIMADAGYGAITLFIGFWLHWHAPQQRDWSRLIIQLALASMVYGILVGSYFGVAPAAASLAASVQLLNLNEFDQMMNLSLLVGMVHLGMALLIKARYKFGLEKWQSLSWFWLLLCIGSYYFYQQENILWLAIITPMIWLLSAVRFGKNLFQRLQFFLSPFMQLSKLFGDVLSYMRLFALGLASASLAMTFNQLSLDVREAFPGMGILLSVLILVLGHFLNFVLAIMGGVVHSMRLNFIEFFNWALAKEGYGFNPFKRS